MTTATATATATLSVHVVQARDIYDTRRCARCKKPCGELDVIVIDGRLVTHYACLARRAQAEAAPPVDAEYQCWYEGCPLEIDAEYLCTTNLCTAHHAILYGSPTKKPRR